MEHDDRAMVASFVAHIDRFYPKVRATKVLHN